MPFVTAFTPLAPAATSLLRSVLHSGRPGRPALTEAASCRHRLFRRRESSLSIRPSGRLVSLRSVLHSACAHAASSRSAPHRRLMSAVLFLLACCLPLNCVPGLHSGREVHPKRHPFASSLRPRPEHGRRSPRQRGPRRRSRSPRHSAPLGLRSLAMVLLAKAGDQDRLPAFPFAPAGRLRLA